MAELKSGEKITINWTVIETRDGNVYLVADNDPGVRIHMFESEVLSARSKETSDGLQRTWLIPLRAVAEVFPDRVDEFEAP